MNKLLVRMEMKHNERTKFTLLARIVNTLNQKRTPTINSCLQKMVNFFLPKFFYLLRS